MGDNATKAQREREVFGRFVAAAGLNVVPGSIESRPTPEPDILCTIAGHGPIAFEVVEMVDQPYAEMESIALQGRQPHAVWYAKSALDCIRTKCRKRTNETTYPMELVVWGGESELELASRVDPSVADRAQQLLDDSTFQRLWVVRLTRTGDSLWLNLKRTT